MRYAELIERAQDTAGIYVAAHFDDETNRALQEFQELLDLPNPSDSDAFHATIVYSRKRIHWRCANDLYRIAKPLRWQVWGSDESRVLVLLIESEYLRTRFKLAMARGATYDFDTYNPHITFSYDIAEGFDIERLPLPDFDITITHERAKELRD